jgi:hypothetical protein
VLRPKLIAAADRHPSDKVRQLGNDLAEDVEKPSWRPLLRQLVHGNRRHGLRLERTSARARDCWPTSWEAVRSY